MVQVDLPGAFAMGQILAWLSRRFLQSTGLRVTHSLMGIIVLYFSVVYAPVGLFLLVGWPAWESMYWWSWIEQPAFHPWTAAFTIAFYLAMMLIGVASYILGHALLQRNMKRTVIALSIIGVIATLVPFFVWPMTWYHIGTHAQYHAVPRMTTTMFGTPAFLIPWAIAIAWLVIGTAATGYCVHAYARRHADTV